MPDSSNTSASVPVNTRLPAGLELLYSSERQNVRTALHAFVLSVHWAIIRAGLRFRSIDQQFTERLPEVWSNLVDQITQGKLILNYIDPTSNETYEIKMLEVSPNDTIVVTIFRQKPATTAASGSSSSSSSPPQVTTSASTFRIASYVNLESFHPTTAEQPTPPVQPLSTIYTNPNELERKLWAELFEPIGLHVLGQPPVPGPYEDKTKKEEKEKAPPDQSQIDYDDQTVYYPGIGPRPSPMRPGPLQPGGIGGPLGVDPIGGGIGRSDLDPLGRFGAGMTADPRGFRNPRNMPPVGIGPGQLPPGARFDPFGPPNPLAPPGTGTRPRPGNFGQLNPDHEQPPPGFDDMFM